MVHSVRHALITGSSRGIGRGIALALAEDGVTIAIHYYRNESAARETLEQVRKRGAQGILVQADVTNPAQITSMFRTLKAEFGKLDVFVSNARPEVPEFFQGPLDITLKQWDTAFDSQADRKSTPELQSQSNLVCRLLLEKKKNKKYKSELTLHYG